MGFSWKTLLRVQLKTSILLANESTTIPRCNSWTIYTGVKTLSKHCQNTVKTLSQYYHNTVTVLGMKEKKKLLLWSQVDKELFTVTTHQPLILSLILEWEVGQIHEWAFQQIFYYLEKPCFVNISTKLRGDARKSQNAVVQLYSIIFLWTVSKLKPKQYKLS